MLLFYFKDEIIWSEERGKSFHLSLTIFLDSRRFSELLSNSLKNPFWLWFIFEKRGKANDDRPTNASEHFPKVTRSMTKKHFNVSLTDQCPIMSCSKARRINTSEHFPISFIVIHRQAVPRFTSTTRSLSFSDHCIIVKENRPENYPNQLGFPITFPLATVRTRTLPERYQ